MSRSWVFLICLAFLAVLAVACGGTAEQPSVAVADAPEAEADEDEAEVPEIPPEDAKPLSEIVAMLEDVGYAPIVEIEYEGGVWEAEALHYGRIVEIAIDPVTGEVIERDE